VTSKKKQPEPKKNYLLHSPRNLFMLGRNKKMSSILSFLFLCTCGISYGQGRTRGARIHPLSPARFANFFGSFLPQYDLLDLSLTCVSCVLDTMPRVKNYFSFMGWIFCINFYADFSFLVSFRIGWGDRKSIEN
jgi:hypothetical protein